MFDTQAEDSQVTYYNESQFDELDDSQATLVEISWVKPSGEANPDRQCAKH